MKPLISSRPILGSTIFLTGATGFLGSALLKALLDSGRMVIATVRPTSQYDRITEFRNHSNLLLVDNEPNQLAAVFKNHQIGVIIHTATEYGRGQTPIASILDSNLILPIRLAELGVIHGVRGFINTDSYFNKPNSSYSNLLNYSLSKKTLLVWLEKLSSKISIANLVLEHMYGPFDSRTKFVEDMIQSIAIERKPYLKLTHGHQRRDFIFYSDVVDAYMKVLDYMENHTFNYKKLEVGTGESMQIKEFVSTISSICGGQTHLDFGAIEYRDDEIMNSQADIRGMTDLGWQPKIKPSEGIIKIIDTYSAHSKARNLV